MNIRFLDATTDTLESHGGDRKSEAISNQGSPTTLKQERGASYLLARLKRDKIFSARRRGQMNAILEKIRRIGDLLLEQEKTKPGTLEHKALLDRIQVLSAEYQALVDAARNPKKSK